MAVPIVYQNFVPPAIDAGNLNTVNNVIYTVIGDGTNAPLNAANVRTNLGLGTVATESVVPVAKGGTGATTAAAAAVNLNVAPIGPTFRAIRITSNQVIPAGVATTILFNGTDWDTNSLYNTGTGRFTPTVAGYYQFNWGIAMLPTSGIFTTCLSSLYKNGVEYARGFQENMVAAAGVIALVLPGSALVFMNGTTDFVDIRGVGVTSTADTTAIPFAAGNVHFSGIFIRP